MSGTIQNDYLPNGTRVLNATDGEPGTIVNGFAYDEDLGGWYEYEVETAYCVERCGARWSGPPTFAANVAFGNRADSSCNKDCLDSLLCRHRPKC